MRKYLDGRRPSITGRDFDTEWEMLKKYIQDGIPEWKDFSDNNPLVRLLKGVCAIGENIHFAADSLFLEGFIETLVERRSIYLRANDYGVDMPLWSCASNRVEVEFAESVSNKRIKKYTGISYSLYGGSEKYTAYTIRDGVYSGKRVELEVFAGEKIYDSWHIAKGVKDTKFYFRNDIDERTLQVSLVGMNSTKVEVLNKVEVVDFDYKGRSTDYCVVKYYDRIAIQFSENWNQYSSLGDTTFSLRVDAIRSNGVKDNVRGDVIDRDSVRIAVEDVEIEGIKFIGGGFTGAEGEKSLDELRELVPILLRSRDRLVKLEDFNTWLRARADVGAGIALDSTSNISEGSKTIYMDIDTVKDSGVGGSIDIHTGEGNITVWLGSVSHGGLDKLEVGLGSNGKMDVSYKSGVKTVSGEYSSVKLEVKKGGDVVKSLEFSVKSGNVEAKLSLEGESFVFSGFTYSVGAAPYGVPFGVVWLLAFRNQNLYNEVGDIPYDLEGPDTYYAGVLEREIKDRVGLGVKAMGIVVKSPDETAIARHYVSYTDIIKEFAINISLVLTSVSELSAGEVMDGIYRHIEGLFGLSNSSFMGSINYLELYRSVYDWCWSRGHMVSSFRIAGVDMVLKGDLSGAGGVYEMYEHNVDGTAWDNMNIGLSELQIPIFNRAVSEVYVDGEKVVIAGE